MLVNSACFFFSCQGCFTPQSNVDQARPGQLTRHATHILEKTLISKRLSHFKEQGRQWRCSDSPEDVDDNVGMDHRTFKKLSGRTNPCSAIPSIPQVLCYNSQDKNGNTLLRDRYRTRTPCRPRAKVSMGEGYRAEYGSSLRSSFHPHRSLRHLSDHPEVKLIRVLRGRRFKFGRLGRFPMHYASMRILFGGREKKAFLSRLFAEKPWYGLDERHGQTMNIFNRQLRGNYLPHATHIFLMKRYQQQVHQSTGRRPQPHYSPHLSVYALQIGECPMKSVFFCICGFDSIPRSIATLPYHALFFYYTHDLFSPLSPPS